MVIHLHSPTQPTLHDVVLEAASSLPKRLQRRHELRIVTCYVDFDAVEKLIVKLAGLVKLRSVLLMFEYMDIFRPDRRPNTARLELESLAVRCQQRNVNFDSIPVRAGGLMHAKAYALIQETAGRTVAGGVTFVSSGNATGRGLGHHQPNTELSYGLTTLKGLHDFLNVWEILARSRKPFTDAAASEDEYVFKYALFSGGMFLHKWGIPFGSQTAIRYGLTRKGKREIIQIREEFRDEFDLERETLSRQPLRLFGGLDTKVGKPLPPHFTRTYAIDTLLGRWCPLDVWTTVEEAVKEDEGFTVFVKKLMAASTPAKLQEISGKEHAFENTLLGSGLDRG